MKLGYLVPEFPGQTHAFFWREAMALEALGLELVFLSTRRPAMAVCPHAFAPLARARTTYLFPPRLRRSAGVLAGPARLASALRHVTALPEAGRAEKARLLALIPSAADLVAVARQEGIGHVHVHSFANAAHLAAIARRMGGPSYSLTLHGDLPVYGRDHAAKVAGAAFVTAVTRPLAAQIAAVAAGRVAQVVPMGVDTDRFCPAARQESPALRMVSVARLNPTKGHIHALRAMAGLVARGVDLRYAIVGDGPHRDAIAAQVQSLGLTDRVELTGAVSEDAVLARLQAANALVLTSFGLGEAAPVAVMEAMACGLPVICSRIGGTAEMIADGEDGLLVPPQDEAAIAAAMLALARQPELRARLGGAARARAVAQFDKNVRATELASLVRGAMAGEALR